MHKRAKASDIDGMPGTWVDIDILHEGAHKKGNLPATVTDALKFIAPHVPAPTLIINSGHGVHMWWLFNQPWIFKNDADRKLAAQLSQSWQVYIRCLFKTQGWDLDTTADLSRVLRPAGTINWKLSDNPREVEILDATPENRYDPEQLRRWIVEHTPEEQAANIPTQRLQGSFSFELRSDATPPVDKWMILQEVDTRVRQSWNHTRTDMQDMSQSGYDMSLASFAVLAHWSDQEVVDLIISNRRAHRADLMLDNRQYYERTLEEAHKKNSTFVFTEDEKKLVEKLESAPGEPITEDDRKNTIALLNRRLAIGDVDAGVFSVNGKGTDEYNVQKVPALCGILCYTKDPPVYYLDLYNCEGERKRARIGDGNDVRDQKKWSKLIYDERQKDMIEHKKAEWMFIRGLITKCIERVSPGVEGSEAGNIQMWINDYAGTDVPVCEWKDKDNWIRDGRPFISRGQLYFSGTGLLNWLRTNRGKNIERNDLSVFLKLVGAEQKTISYKYDEKVNDRTTMRLWHIPYGKGGIIEPTITDIEDHEKASRRSVDIDNDVNDESTEEF
jgi:hypothetical protein